MRSCQLKNLENMQLQHVDEIGVVRGHTKLTDMSLNLGGFAAAPALSLGRDFSGPMVTEFGSHKTNICR